MAVKLPPFPFPVSRPSEGHAEAEHHADAKPSVGSGSGSSPATADFEIAACLDDVDSAHGLCLANADGGISGAHANDTDDAAKVVPAAADLLGAVCQRHILDAPPLRCGGCGAFLCTAPACSAECPNSLCDFRGCPQCERLHTYECCREQAAAHEDQADAGPSSAKGLAPPVPPRPVVASSNTGGGTACVSPLAWRARGQLPLV